MVKTSLVLVVLSFALAGLLYYRVSSLTTLRAFRVVGVDGCAGCHGTQALGDQAGIWRRSAHAKAYASLANARATAWRAEHNGADPQHDSACLACHAPLAGSGFAEEGVSCETCHGPGSSYASASVMKSAALFPQLGGRRGSTTDCATCHHLPGAPSPCPFDSTAFDTRQAMLAIVHPVPPSRTEKAR